MALHTLRATTTALVTAAALAATTTPAVAAQVGASAPPASAPTLERSAVSSAATSGSAVISGSSATTSRLGGAPVVGLGDAPAVGVGVDVRSHVAGRSRRTVGGQRGFFVEAFPLPRVEAALLPYAGPAIPLRPVGWPVDRHGIVMYSDRTGRMHDHPVVQASHVLGWLASYERTGDRRFLTTALRHGERLRARSVVSRGGRFHPYDNRFPLHGDPRHVMSGRWYSAMAQGEVMAAYLRLHRATGDARWKTAADETFTSFTLPRSGRAPWVASVDRAGLLWLEEFPHPTAPDRAFNGHDFALFGLYEYWWATGRPEAADLVRGALTSTLTYAPSIRRRGQLSRYCLTHDIRNDRYHGIHVRQLYVLAGLAGDRRFAGWADTFLADAPAAYGGGPGRLHAGTHRLVTLDRRGRVVSRTRARQGSTRSVTFDKRARIAGEAGVWLRLASGAHRGRWVRENPASASLTGSVESFPFTPARSLILPRGARAVYRIDARGRRQVGRLARPASGRVAVDGRTLHDGTPMVRLADGPHAGAYVVLGAGTSLR